MSAINGDKARFHRRRKHKVALRDRMQELRKKLNLVAKEPVRAA